MNIYGKCLKEKKNDRRIAIRVSEEDKELLEYESSLRGYTSLSEFVRVTITREVNMIVAKEKRDSCL